MLILDRQIAETEEPARPQGGLAGHEYVKT
jgi:hypothetical protein